MGTSGFDARLAQERRARLQAERLLALRSEELYSANRKLAEHAHALSHQVIEQREENAALKGRTSQVAAELRIATDRAARAERRLWDALTAAEDGFAIFDRDSRLVVANPAWLAPFEGITDVAPGAGYEAILRIAADEGVVDLEGADPDDWLDRMLARWEEEVIPRAEIRLWNGTFIRLVDTRTPHGDTVCLSLDITSMIDREQELREARDAALAASRAKSAFLANMSHEIRTPMTGIVSMAELLGETALSADQKLYADTMRRSGEALLEIIKDILDYSKIEAGKLQLHTGEFDLLTVILEVFGLLHPGLEGRDIDLRLDLDLDLPDRLIGDCGRIRQVLFNLVGNAVKFTETGHVEVSVRAERGAAGGTVPLRISVTDTGIGIAPELQTHVFGEFNQAEDQTNRRYDGTGLGLAITRRLIDLMGGEIRLKSAPGKGSAFTFDITLAEAPREAGELPRLPDERRECRLVGPVFSERAHDLIVMLAHLGCRVRATPRLVEADLPAQGDIVILLHDAAGSAAVQARLRDLGGPADCFHLCEPGEAPAPGLLPLVLPRGAAQLAEVLSQPARALSAVAQGACDSSPSGGRPLRRLSLLAAEDNRTNQLVFRTMLKGLDLDLRIVDNGADLVEAYRQAPPDLVFTDISMPGMDGIEATSLIRAHEAGTGLPRAPIIAMTAHAVSGDRERFLAAGMDDYLTKPLKKSGLVECIAAFSATCGA
ncbi:ATP-binding protein [Roseibacterium sp. SDUM158017]|uniref:ATP-binding protein n=1 Tax=Roseicyclus salinarum TaxID=3036773 RepID=UPI002415464A|nr:ATP-binding protein [Roseibacterium sp. SDUM158017]MDG4647013.1 ATP-binding protein [Roseibacterium sp. SDUM158017]